MIKCYQKYLKPNRNKDTIKAFKACVHKTQKKANKFNDTGLAHLIKSHSMGMQRYILSHPNSAVDEFIKSRITLQEISNQD